jgi:PTH1 family peptidyl-tRNA hydrolase
MTYLIIGLGNPGAEYDNSRHNVGFATLDLLSDDWKKQGKSLISKIKIGTSDAILAKPQTFMNLSGNAVQELMAFYKIPLENMIVIHDDIDLKPGDLRTKIGGGAAGHNGLKNIDQMCGKEYFRIRIGVGHPRDSETPQMDVADWVVNKMPTADAKNIEPAISAAVNELKTKLSK